MNIARPPFALKQACNQAVFSALPSANRARLDNSKVGEHAYPIRIQARCLELHARIAKQRKQPTSLQRVPLKPGLFPGWVTAPGFTGWTPYQVLRR